MSGDADGAAPRAPRGAEGEGTGVPATATIQAHGHHRMVDSKATRLRMSRRSGRTADRVHPQVSRTTAKQQDGDGAKQKRTRAKPVGREETTQGEIAHHEYPLPQRIPEETCPQLQPRGASQQAHGCGERRQRKARENDHLSLAPCASGTLLSRAMASTR